MDPFKNKVTSLGDYVAKVCAPRCRDSIFRGVEDAAHPLIPPLGRAWRWSLLKEGEERAMLDTFEKRGLPYVPAGARLGPGDWAALAYEHRLPGRLLAWTRLPLVALWHACQGPIKVAGVVYVQPVGRLAEAKPADPLGGKRVSLLVPGNLPVGAAPGTVYTCHPNPRKEWAPRSLIALRVSGVMKRHLRRDLERLGVDDAFVNPGLTGVARTLSR